MYDAARGDKVRADQEVDLGLTITIDEKNYKVIFAKSNLTKDGLAANEYDYGDYFAWGATEPWYSEINNTSTNCSEWTAVWKSDKTDGYYETTCPSYNNDAEYVENGILKMEYDPARTILGGEWQIPTKAIWQALVDNSTNRWDDGTKGYIFTNNSQTLFLPAAGNVWETSFNEVGLWGSYWSGTADSEIFAYCLCIMSDEVDAQGTFNRSFGCSVRPVRLVEVSQSQQ